MKKLIMINKFLFLALILFSNSLVFAESKDKIKVGISLPLSGVAPFGVAVKNGIELFYSTLPKDQKEKFELIYEDDQNSSIKAVSVYKKLREFDDIDVLITCTSNTSKAVSSLANRDKIPQIAIASDYGVVENKDYAVNLWVTPDSETEKLIKEVRKRGYKKLARISAIHDGTLAFKKSFDKYNQGSVSIVDDREVTTDLLDFKSIIQRIKRKKDVDAILVNLYTGQNGVFAKQAKEMGLAYPLFNYELFESEQEVKLSKGTLIGAWYVQASAGDNKFLDKYRKAYPKAPTFGAANGYDAIGLIVSAVNLNQDINKYLHSVKDYKGALGKYSAKGDNTFTLPAVIKTITKDGFKVLY